MNELRSHFESAAQRFESLDEVDIESVLDRLELLSELKRKYGGIAESLAYLQKKREELARYDSIETTHEDLEAEIARLESETNTLAKALSSERKKALAPLQKELNGYLDALYLREAQLLLEPKELDASGIDRFVIRVGETPLEKMSTGEFNRLRLAVLALKSEFLQSEGGVLMLDEIDANLSGEESMSVAKVLRKLSKKYQIFVISHQPQLSSMGEQHFLVYKESGESKVKELGAAERVEEIARIISGESISDEARSFAKELLDGSE